MKTDDTSIVKTDNLEELSKAELIEKVRALDAKTKTHNANDLIQLMSSIAWKKEDSNFISSQDLNEDVKRFTDLFNTIIQDFKDLNQDLSELKEEFNSKLQFQVGERLHQEASLRSIFNSLDSIIWMIDPDFNLMAFNDKFFWHMKEYYGIVPEVGMNLMEYKELTDSFQKIYKRINKALQGKEANYRDYYHENDAVVKVVDSKIFPVILNNDLSGVACLSEDITESFQATETIKSNEKIIASVNKNISEAIYRSSREKGLIFVNEAFVKIFGYSSKEELYQSTSFDKLYANPEDRARLSDLLINKKELTNIEVEFRKKNGETFTGLISSMISEDEQGVRYFDGAIRDVSIIKGAQEKLKKQNRELKKLNTELDSFVYSASHDLKAPLSSVKGLISLAKNESDQQQLAQYLNLADKSIDKLDDFIKDIIDLSRNARQKVKPEVVNFDLLIEETFDNYQYLPDFGKVEKIVDFKTEIPFYSDKRRLKVIVNNLISNAIRYFNPFIDNPYVKISIIANEQEALIEVSDNGLGIDAQYLDKIFDMFYRASDHSQGTGIGLYIVKETLQKIKGKIEVESEVEKGTLFRVSIPNLKKS